MRKRMGITFIIYIFVLVSLIGSYVVNSQSDMKWDLITSNSMEPTLMTNSLVCTDYTIPYEDIEIGDIIRYTEKNITDREIMHRVYQKTELPNGEIIIITKGDNLAVPDRWTVTEDTYIGKVVDVKNDVVPILDFLYSGNAQQVNTISLILIVVGFLLVLFGLIYGVVSIVCAVLNKKRR